jgi:hypothetical protein
MGLLSVTVDLDEIDCYHAIHGLEKPAVHVENVIYGRVLSRIAQFFEELEVPGTFFVVGKDLAKGGRSVSVLRDLSARGHEIGNHSMNHLYDLTELTPYEIENEINQGGQLIEETIGKPPEGFRAPGYNIHLGIIDVLKHNRYLYDSSVFPCPVYYSAKAGAMGLKAMKGMPSASILGDPRILRAPVGPYKIGDDGVWTRGERFTELPITVVTPARLPFIGTSLAMMGKIPAVLLARVAAKLSFVNLELHGIDFADADGDGIGHLKEVQPDLRIPLTKRRETLAKVIKTLLDAGMEPVTLRNAAKRLFIS